MVEEYVEVKSHGEIDRYLRRSIILLKGSQALPARPFDKCSMKVKKFELLQAVA
jgi:hypothetical protein